MFNTITPEQAGISSKTVNKFIRTLEKRGLAMHSVLLMKGNDIFGEFYWKPFHKDICHRMYSQTKSYVAIAIGLLEQENKIDINKRIAEYFPEKIETELNESLKNLTVRDMLTMQTCGKVDSWFKHEETDRVKLYFMDRKAETPSGMRWKYDSAGSQVLSTLVEKLSGQTLFDYLNDRIFSKLGTFKTASILKTKSNDSWGDSALLCTSRDMASFARFLMNHGKWNNEQILNKEYIITAMSRLTDNDEVGFDGVLNRGYGYQIWRCDRNGFAFNGMGAQLTLCFPEKDLIFVCTSDNQGYVEAKSLILTALYEMIVDNIQDVPLEENKAAYQECISLSESLNLCHLSGNVHSDCQHQIDRVTYKCDPNDMGIKQFQFKFTEDSTGELIYTNEQGEKHLRFGLGKNVFSKFPQLGYSNEHGGLATTDGFMYDCAVSAAWREQNKLYLKVQIIDKYLGNMFARFAFKNDIATVTMVKAAEAFLEEYNGIMTATKEL